MAEIEWGEETELRPGTASLETLCSERGLPVPDQAPAILIARPALEGLNDFLEADIEREHGGVLAGLPYYDPLRRLYCVDIQVAVPALDSQGSATHLQFTPQTWDFISGILQDEHPGLTVVGWYHSHPQLGVFMSATDRATQRAFYGHPWSLALVVDPVARQSGWFLGPDCRRLGSGEVVVYEPQGTRLPPDPTFPQFLRWFLPVVLAGTVLLGGFWLVRKWF